MIQYFKMAVITRVQISFTTPPDTDDKDPNTEVHVVIRKSNFEVVAEVRNTWGRFPDDGTTQGPFEIPKKPNVQCTPDELVHGRAIIGIRPQGGLGHDTWVFDHELVVLFNDGTSICSSAHRVALDQNHKEAEFGLYKS